MSGITSGEETQKKAYSTNVQAKAQSSSTCSFCWYVLSIYPTLKDMTPKDTATFQEHLTKAHGLSREIAP